MRTDRNLNTKNSTFITYFKQLQTNQRTQKSRNILPETTRPCNKRFTTHCESMRNLRFFKSTNTNSQTLCNSEELLAEKAVSANSNSSSEKTERLELGIGILFQCEDLQFWNFEFLRNFIICFTFSTENEKYLVIWLPGLLSGLFYRPTGQGSSSAEAFLCFSDLLGYHILSPSNLKTGS